MIVKNLENKELAQKSSFETMKQNTKDESNIQ